MISEILNLYISIYILVLIAFAFLQIFRKFADPGSALKMTYGLIILSVATPIILSQIPGEDPFAPVAKFWMQENNVQAPVSKAPSLMIQAPVGSPAAIPMPYDNQLQDILFWSLILFSLIAVGRCLKSLYQLRQTIKESTLLKQIGRTSIWVSPAAKTPFAFYYRGARVILPISALYDPKALKFSVSHELQHHRQKDTLWIYVFALFKIAGFTLPISKKLEKQIMELQEFACDRALAGRKEFSVKQYGQCLLAFAKLSTQNSPPLVGTLGMATDVALLKRRIETMMNTQKTLKTSRLCGLFALMSTILISAGWASQKTVARNNKWTSAQNHSALEPGEYVTSKSPVFVLKLKQKGWNWFYIYSDYTSKTKQALQRLELHRDMIEKKLRDADLPKEFIAVPFVESQYRSAVTSSYGSSGLWQFIPETARIYGLVVNGSRDDRNNPELATDAAIKYYKKLYKEFGNWHIVLAAFNSGEGRMRDSIAQAGHKDPFKLADDGYLGTEGSTYIHKVMAAISLVTGKKPLNN